MTLLKEHYIPNWGKKFNEAGFATLIYDHRGWGSSDGSPRYSVDPLQQAEDYHDAIIFAGSLPGIDKTKVAIWGIGHGGGASMIAASNDRNLWVVILMMPFFSGKWDEDNYPPGAMDRVWDERRRLVLDPSATPGSVQVWDNSAEQAASSERGEIILHAPGAFKFIDGAKALSDAAGTPWENKMTVQSMHFLSKAEPRDYIAKIKCPMLYLAAKEDEISGPIELERATYDRATAEKRKWVELEGLHLDNYFDERLFSINVKAQIDFLKENL